MCSKSHIQTWIWTYVVDVLTIEALVILLRCRILELVRVLVEDSGIL